MWQHYQHDIDPILGQVAGFYLWWYGLSYSLGLGGIFVWLRRGRQRLGIRLEDVYALSLLLATGVLFGGRLMEVFAYEWSYYGDHGWHIPAIWLGGMSTHGVLAGALGALWFFSRWKGVSFLALADELTIPAAWVMGTGRIGNFIDGQIAGALTTVPWGVQFPDLEGIRHPVVLYDGLKNFMLIPLLLGLRKKEVPRGILTGNFLFWYAFLRIFVDLFRDYRVSFFEVGVGQIINIGMALMGVGLILILRRAKTGRSTKETEGGKLSAENRIPLWKKFALAFILAVCLILPSDWTQDIPSRYGDRHEGLEYSALYPRIDDIPSP